MAKVQNTLAIIKPDYIHMKNRILQLLHQNGFRVSHRKTVFFTPEKAAEFYKDLEKSDPCFAVKVMALSKGASEAFILNKVNAIKDLLTMLTSHECSDYLNSELEHKIHASSSEENAVKDIKYIFPCVIMEPSRNIHFKQFCEPKQLMSLLGDGIFEICKNRANDVRQDLSDWLLAHSYQFESNSWCEQ